MNFAHDPDNNFYCMSEESMGPGMYRKLLVDAEPKLIAVDTETISLKEKIAIGISVATTPTTSFYFPVFPNPSPVTPWWLLRNPEVRKVYHNSLFDLVALREYDVDYTNIHDTSDLARLLCYPSAELGDLSMILDGTQLANAKELLTQYHGTTMLNIPVDTVASMCCTHSLATYRIYDQMLPHVDMPYYEMEMALIPIMVKMSYRGIKIDQQKRQEVEDKLQTEVDYYRTLCENEGFMPSSPQQVAYMLAKRGAYGVFTRLPFTRSKDGRNRHKNLSTDEATLEKMDDPLATIVLDYRGKAKLLGTYVKPWRGEDRAYTRFHVEAITGRPSSTDRNMQNLPTKQKDNGDCRGMLVPDSGFWTDADLSQAEMRILAWKAQDREMLHIFSLPKNNPDGTPNVDADIHQQTANFMGIERKVAKNVGFCMVYGGSAQTIMETAHIRDMRLAASLRADWFRKFPQAGDWIESEQERVMHDPYVYTVLGRRIRLPDPETESEDGLKRKGINYQIQGSAAEILKRSLIRLDGLGWDLALQVHDEVLADGIYQLPDDLADITPVHCPWEVKYLARWE